ncbi:MAG: hypothetical protein AAF665_05890 [Pseudomonadota bacterium]
MFGTPSKQVFGIARGFHLIKPGTLAGTPAKMSATPPLEAAMIANAIPSALGVFAATGKDSIR